MKKWLILTLVLLLLSGCAEKAGELPADGPETVEEPGVEHVISSGGESPAIWERAPELTVTDGAAGVPALKCTTSWYYENADGIGTGINACGSSPLQSKEYMQPLVTDAGRGWLDFELAPDSVTVQCWSAEYFGQYHVEGETVEVEVLAADFEDGSWSETISIPLKEGGWVYEVTATWDSREEYGGTIWYGFYTE